jgi:hypothetical protein
MPGEPEEADAAVQEALGVAEMVEACGKVLQKIFVSLSWKQHFGIFFLKHLSWQQIVSTWWPHLAL